MHFPDIYINFHSFDALDIWLGVNYGSRSSLASKTPPQPLELATLMVSQISRLSETAHCFLSVLQGTSPTAVLDTATLIYYAEKLYEIPRHLHLLYRIAQSSILFG